MSNYEGKLGEWLKYVQQQVEAVAKPGDKKSEDQPQPVEQEMTGQPVEVPKDVIVRDRLGRLTAEDAAEVDPKSVIGDYSLIEDRQSRTSGNSLFDEDDIPNVEDFLPFLKDKVEPAQKPPVMPNIETIDDRLNTLPEGTGTPKPVIKAPVDEPKVIETPVAKAEPVVNRPVAKATPTPKPAAPAQAAKSEDVSEMWNQLPRHIQFLAGTQTEEVAQNSYKMFKETRNQLVARLLDPEISLEEAARVLNVCPTTVRRYTNKGALPHHRTGGNQRRFRLSDVLAFLESNTRGTAA